MNDPDDLYLVWRYVDVHAHIRHPVRGTSAPAPGGQSFEKYLARMAQTNIVAAIPSTAGGGPLEGGLQDVRDRNDATAAGCRRYAQRFPLGLALLEPACGPGGAAEIERAMTRAGLAGLMCPPAAPGAAAEALTEVLPPALEAVDARGGLALLHVGGGGLSPQAAATYARRFHRTTFIMANVSLTEAGHRESIAALAGVENVWCDFARHPGHPATAEGSWDLPDLVRGLSAGRLLFGSDAPYYDYRQLQQEIEVARIDSPRKDRITWANAVELIQRFRPGWTPPPAPPDAPPAFAGVPLWQPLPGKPGRLL
ncbi:MAG TPA: amidohydrolase family protein [Chloroflexota bacterium]|nr:amidohydrolase family protein [Chloroflexota bacterium]